MQVTSTGARSESNEDPCLSLVKSRPCSRGDSTRESPVAWEGEAADGVESSQAPPPGGAESPGHNQGRKRWDTEEDAKEEPAPPGDEGSTSGVGGVNPFLRKERTVFNFSVSGLPAGGRCDHLVLPVRPGL